MLSWSKKFGGEYCYHCQLESAKVYCKNPRCHEKIFKSEKLCSNCKNDKDAVRLISCSACRVNYHYGDRLTKCREHGNCCLSCNERIPEYMRYCSEHINSCQTCEKRIASGQKYCKVHQETEQLKSLVQQRTSLSNPQEVIRFNTCWNNNLATVINGNNPYTLWLLVYEPAVKSRSEILQKFEISNGYDRYNLASAKNKASSLRNELNGENPILAIHPYANSYVSFSSLITSPYVWKEEIGNSFCFSIPLVITVGAYQAPSSLNDYFKSLDIIRVKKVNSIVGKTYFHVGIYLGKNAICHVCDPNGLISEENLQARITGWDAFLNGWLGTPINGRAGELQRYRSVIPFKSYKKSIEQAVKAYWADYGSGKYDLYNDNCEHFANAIIFGTYYSQQIADNNVVENFLGKVWDEVWTKNHNFFWKVFQPNHWGTLWRDAPILRAFNSNRYKVNNDKGSTINLRNEINSWDSNGRFCNLTSSELRDRRDEYESQYLIEVPPKQECKIM